MAGIYLSDSWPVTQTTSLGGRDYGTSDQILRTSATVVGIYLSDSWPVTQTRGLCGKDYCTPDQILRTSATVVGIYLSDSWSVTQTRGLGGRDYGTPGQVLRTCSDILTHGHAAQFPGAHDHRGIMLIYECCIQHAILMFEH